MIVVNLNQNLPLRYVAEPQIHLGASIEINVATYEEVESPVPPIAQKDKGGGVATATWTPSRPTLEVPVDLPSLDEYEVRVYDTKSGRRVVAAVEIVSPANKDRPEHRRACVAKCAGLLQNHVCVTIVDLVTTRTANLYHDLLALFGQKDSSMVERDSPLYAPACRWSRREQIWYLETRAHSLPLGRPLPTLPLWLSENLAVPLDLERAYEETCRILRMS